MLIRGTNTKSMNLKVSVSPIPDFWKGFRMSLGHVFIGKKARPSWTQCSNYADPRLHVQRQITFFASLPSRRLC